MLHVNVSLCVVIRFTAKFAFVLSAHLDLQHVGKMFRECTFAWHLIVVSLCCRTDGYIACEEHEEILKAAWENEQEIQKKKEQEVRVCVCACLCVYIYCVRACVCGLIEL